MDRYLIAVDQGTSGTMASLFNQLGERVLSVDIAVDLKYPHPGWVEQDPFELLQSIKSAVKTLIQKAGLKRKQIVSIGLANQGECLLLWDALTGKPVYPMIGWQCTRSADFCDALRAQGVEGQYRKKTGLPIDPEWPATKIPWIFENVPEAKKLLAQGRLVFSQSDSWFTYQLTEERNIFSDHSTAGRSGLYSIRAQDWDPWLIELHQAGGIILPEIRNSADDFGTFIVDDWKIPWQAIVLDQSVAMVGQGCLQRGQSKITFGTCAGMWMNLGKDLQDTSDMFEISAAWQIDGDQAYALVGESMTAGNLVTWLTKQMFPEIEVNELDKIAESVKNEQTDLKIIPAFTGLGVPYRAPKVRGTIFGINDATTNKHIIRAALDAIAFSVKDIQIALEKEGYSFGSPLKVDGGLSGNSYLMQALADILQIVIGIPQDRESTSIGVASLAGMQSGFFGAENELVIPKQDYQYLEPQWSEYQADDKYQQWTYFVDQVLQIYEN